MSHFQTYSIVFILSLVAACSSSSTGSGGLDSDAGSGGSENGTGGASGASGGASGSTGGSDGSGGADASGGADGSGGSDDGGSSGGSSGEGSGGTSGDGGDTTAPQVVSIDPEDLASEVTSETITIEFSEPMNQSTVEAVFEGAEFDWNGDGTTVTIQASLPFTETPQAHTITLPTSVSDLAGNSLSEPYSITIVLAALHNVTLDFEGATTGNQRPGASVGTFIQTGDSDMDALRYAGISFVLSSLPPHSGILSVRRATMRSQVISIEGNPNAPGLNGFLVDHVTFSGRNVADDSTILESGFATLFTPGSIVVGEPVSLDVTEQLDSSWEAGHARFQVRVYPGGTNSNQIPDILNLRRGGSENGSIVDDSLMEPDPANRMRLEIEYFD